MNKVEYKRVAAFAQAYVRRLNELLEVLDLEALTRVIQTLEDARLAQKNVFIIGNGGSAATASHMAQDLAFGTRHRSGERFRALSLADNISYISAAANDMGYENIFEIQLTNLLQKDDVLIAISASGNSPNIVKGVELARQRGAHTIALVGFDGGWLKENCDIVLHTSTMKGEYGPVEDMHMILDHLIMNFLNDLG